MKIIIKTKKLELTEALQTFIEKKIGTVKKFISILKEDIPGEGKTLAEVFVEVGKETKHHKKGDIFKAKINVRLPGKFILAEATSDDLFKAIIESRDELKIEIEKYKLKNIDKNRRLQRKLQK